MLINYHATAGMRNSKHNFSQEVWSNGKICEVCHTKEFFNLDVSQDVGSGSGEQGEARETITLLCLQCHSDHNPGEPMVTHPPAFSSPKSFAKFKSIEKGGLGGTIVIGVNDQSQNNYRRCAQCHDVHKTENNHLLIDSYGEKHEN